MFQDDLLEGLVRVLVEDFEEVEGGTPILLSLHRIVQQVDQVVMLVQDLLLDLLDRLLELVAVVHHLLHADHLGI